MFRTAKHGVGLLLCWFVLAGQVWAKTCDLDGDGDVDLDDITLLQRMLPSRPTVTGPDDPRDANHDGRIDILDVRACVLSCTRAKCSTINQAPFANAGPDQSVSLGSRIPLDGSASRDPEGATLSYAWSLIAGPPDSQAVLTAAHSTNPTFRADLPGQYVVQLIVHDGQLASAPATVSILVTNTPPTVSLSAPAAYQSFTAPATITVSADAADSTGSITEVAFYQGSTPIGSATSAPYRISWSNVPAGSYVLKAKATDSGGAMTWSAEVPITVAAGGVKIYYLHHDHLNTPRLVTDEANRVVWRNTPLGEPFGMSLPEEDPDGDGQAFTLNLRFPGQYADRESHLNYNYFRDYNPEVGRYLQSDPIGLAGGINTYGYVGGNPMSRIDSFGLWWPGIHNSLANSQAKDLGWSQADAVRLGNLTGDVDDLPGSQNRENSDWHAMRDPSWERWGAQQNFSDYVKRNLADCSLEGLAKALHTIQDSYSPGHEGFQPWWGRDRYSWVQLIPHFFEDGPWMIGPLQRAKAATRRTIQGLDTRMT
jgi:RHS repeat-associated protein